MARQNNHLGDPLTGITVPLLLNPFVNGDGEIGDDDAVVFNARKGAITERVPAVT